MLPIDAPRALRSGEELPRMVSLRCAGHGRVIVDGLEMDEARARVVIATALAESPDLQGVVQCRSEAPTGEMLALIDLLRDVGVRKYALATEVGGPVEPEPPPR
jgi:biopolymer transport protein ExbD